MEIPEKAFRIRPIHYIQCVMCVTVIETPIDFNHKGWLQGMANSDGWTADGDNVICGACSKMLEAKDGEKVPELHSDGDGAERGGAA